MSARDEADAVQRQCTFPMFKGLFTGRLITCGVCEFCRRAERMRSEVPPDEVLACGCVLRCAVVDGVNTLTVIPCKPTCVNYRNALGLAAETAVPVEYREAP